MPCTGSGRRPPPSSRPCSRPLSTSPDGVQPEPGVGALAEECQQGLDIARGHVPDPMELETALADPAGFRMRRDLVDAAHRWLDQLPCLEAEERAAMLPGRIHNLDVVSRRVEPGARQHPTPRDAGREIRRSRTWLRSLDRSRFRRLAIGVSGRGPLSSIGGSLGYHHVLVQRGAPVFGWRLSPAVRPSPESSVEIDVPLDLFAGIGPARRRHVVVQPQIHGGGEIGWSPEQTVGRARFGGGAWLLPFANAGHGLFIDVTATLRPDGDAVTTGVVAELGYHFQWARRREVDATLE